MKENNFQVSCPSCETLFEVTDPELVGQIVACPKCGGMMMIAPPEQVVEDDKSADAESQDSPKEQEPDAASLDARERSQQEEPGAAQERRESPSEQRDVLASEEFANLGSPVRKFNAKLFLFASGAVCVIGAALFFGILRTYRPTPDNKPDAELRTSVVDEEIAREPDAPEEATLDPDVPDAQDEHASLFQEEALSLDSGGVDVDGFGFGDNANIFENTGAESADFEDETDTDDAEPSGDETLAPEDDVVTIDGEDEGLDPFDASDDEEIVEDDLELEETEIEEPDEDEIPTEFDEAEFEEKNQPEEEDPTAEEDLGAVASTIDVSLQSSLPILKVEPREIDVDERLALRIRSIVFPESPAAALRLLSEFSGVPFEIDLDRFALLRPSLNMKLDLKLDDVDVKDALAQAAEMLKWNVRQESDRVVIEPQRSDLSDYVEERFEVADLLEDVAPFLVEIEPGEAPEAPGKITPDALVRFITSLTPAQSWNDEEGKGTIALDGTTLVVANDSLSRRLVETLLEQLRVLRRLNSGSKIVGETLIPESLGWETLARRTPFNLLKPVSLQQAIETLENKFKFLVLWDDAALNSVGVGRDSLTGARFASAPLEQILSDLLAPLQLTYVILDERLLLITTLDKANAYKTVEIHGFSTLDSPKTFEEALSLSSEMQAAVAPDSWNEESVAIWLDVENSCWMIYQSQPVQREIRRWTDALLEKEAAAERKKSGLTTPLRAESIPEVASRPRD
ncbi:MAG: hypothetical protein ACOX0A_06120 [Thermoguttaceae bacterium]|jgi:predicted  nucleic acid-binding Zn-ribbon protein